MVFFLVNGKAIQETFMNSTTPSSSGNGQSDVKVKIEYYYTDGCGFCKEFNNSGVWEELNKLTLNKVSLHKLKMDENQSRASKFQITSVPSIIAVDVKSDTIVNSHNGERSYDKLKEFIMRYEGPSPKA